MNKQANILFIPSSISGNSAERRAALSQHGFLQEVIHASVARSMCIERFEKSGRRLAAVARHAHLLRQMDAVEQASQMMLALPISNQLRGIARYYQALCVKHQGDFDGARRALERAAEEATPQYRARALQTIGATYYERGEIDAALPFYLAAGRRAGGCDLLTLIESQRMTAVVRGIHGDHKHALADLEGLFPLVSAIGTYYPAAYYDFLNSVAVELGEVGRLVEAEAAVSIALGAPFASAYPEWRETRDEIAAKRLSATPSVVAIRRVPEREHSPAVDTELKRKPSRAPALPASSHSRDSFQRAIIPKTATAAVPHDGITQNILSRVLICIGSRAPPVRF